jgi:hypothetical protein
MIRYIESLPKEIQPFSQTCTQLTVLDTRLDGILGCANKPWRFFDPVDGTASRSSPASASFSSDSRRLTVKAMLVGTIADVITSGVANVSDQDETLKACLLIHTNISDESPLSRRVRPNISKTSNTTICQS